MLKKALLISLPMLAMSGSVIAHPCAQLNPQPEPPGVSDSARPAVNQLNPQPEPPGVAASARPARQATWSAGSDSGNDSTASGGARHPVRDATWAAGSDSSEEQASVAHPVRNATWSAGSDSSGEASKANPAQRATWAAGSDSGNDSHARVQSVMIAANYTNIHNIHFADGAWKADGSDSNGVEQEVTIDANDGHVVSAMKVSEEMGCEQGGAAKG